MDNRNTPIRLAVIGSLLLLFGALFLHAGGWFQPHALTPATMIDTFEHVNGEHPGSRRNHAKGVCITGYFESNGRGQPVSRALVFRAGRVPIVGRFALAGGDPYAADTPQTVRSLAILFKQPDGEEWRTAMVNIPVFVVNTPEDFAEFLVVSSPTPATGKVDPGAMASFLAKHPETADALKIIKSHPFSSGFDDSTYYALNAFRFINGKGQSSAVRWSLVPEQTPDQPLAAKLDQNYLFDGLIRQLHTQPLRWRLVLTIGRPEDPTAKAASVWTPGRQEVDAGVLTIDAVESEETSPTRDINFDPLILPDGIAPSDDPLLSARSAAYSQSFTRREREPKGPSAVSSKEVRQ